MKRILEDDLKQTLDYIEEIRSQLVKRGKEKLDAANQGFGQHNEMESISFRKEGVHIYYIDSGYDLVDTACITLSIPEICMSHEEWVVHLIKMRDKMTELEGKRLQVSEEQEREKRRRQYLKFKKEFED